MNIPKMTRVPRDTVRNMRGMPTLAPDFAAIAKARKAYYDAHIDAGFTPDQAMELVRQFNAQATPGR